MSKAKTKYPVTYPDERQFVIPPKKKTKQKAREWDLWRWPDGCLTQWCPLPPYHAEKIRVREILPRTPAKRKGGRR